MGADGLLRGRGRRICVRQRGCNLPKTDFAVGNMYEAIHNAARHSEKRERLSDPTFQHP